MKKILFIDRDGTIIQEPPVDFQVDSLAKLEFVPGVIGALRRVVEETDYRLVMVSNQDGLGTPSFPMEDFLPPQELMLKTLAGEGIVFDEVLIDESFPEENSPRRKPRTGMVEKYLNEYLDYENSYVIGDRVTDMQLAANMGIRGIFLGDAPTEDLPVALSSSSWGEIAAFLKLGSRKAKIFRKTSETSILVELDLNGSGRPDIHTGLAFFDHMLEQIARHGGVDLTIKADGDLEVDEHRGYGNCVGRMLCRSFGAEERHRAVWLCSADGRGEGRGSAGFRRPGLFSVAGGALPGICRGFSHRNDEAFFRFFLPEL